MRARPIGIGLRARRGGAVVVGVRIGAGGAELAVSTFVATHVADDALAKAPFAAAHDLVHRRRAPRGEAEALVAEARRRQDAAAVEGLAALAARLDAPLTAALLVNRARRRDALRERRVVPVGAIASAYIPSCQRRGDRRSRRRSAVDHPGLLPAGAVRSGRSSSRDGVDDIA